MRDRLEIEDILRAEVQRTAQELDEAKRDFRRVYSDIPSGIPHPDGNLRLQKTAHVRAFAMKAFAKALQRFNSFVLDGAIPEDLKK
jgi:hypothetical protein